MDIRILVVEDSFSLRKSLGSLLRRQGYSVFQAADVPEARRLFLSSFPDIVLLDIMLPSGEGYELIPFFREQQECTILMLTALSDSKSKRLCYEYGADDYICKPFDMFELIYKLTAISRRIRASRKVFSIGDVTLDCEQNELRCRKVRIPLQPSQARCLHLLYERQQEGSFLSKQEAQKSLGLELNSNVRLHTLVNRLRSSLQDSGSQEVLIETIYGKGYSLVILESGGS